MRYISLFAGIEAASVAWESLGWEPVAFSEIEPFPCEVLAQRFPDVPNLGDITDIDWSPYAGNIDLIVGGSPCQSFSIAGNREGLRGESGLMFEYIRAVQEVRPRYFIWENVPGALSSEKGGAFRQLLTEMDGLGYGLAWRVLDAQFFRVAQRRRRVFLVGSLGDMRAAEILFERESLRWDHPSSRDKRQELTARALRRALVGCAEALEQDLRDADGSGLGRVRGEGAAPLPAYTVQVRCGCDGGGKGALVQEDVSATLSTTNVQTLFQPVEECLTPWDTQSRRIYSAEGAAPTLDARENSGQNAQAFLVPTIGFAGKASATAGTIGANEELAPTLMVNRQDACVCYAIQGDIARGAHMGQNGKGWSDEDVSYTLNTMDQHAVVCMTSTQANTEIDEDLCGTLTQRSYKDAPVVVGDERRVLPFNATQITHPANGSNPQWGDPCHTLAATDYAPHIVEQVVGDEPYVIDRAAFNQGRNAQFDARIEQSDCAPTIVAKGPCAVAAPPEYIVRRLTPIECARLQGFPDDWLDIEFKGKPASDSAKYKALGNSMAVPNMYWIGARIDELELFGDIKEVAA